MSRPDRRRSAAAASGLLLVALWAQATLGETPSNADYTTNEDWASGISAQGPGGCTMAKKAAFQPPPTCPPPRVPVPRDQAVKLGHRFAPILYQHPLDSSWLSDPSKWFKQADKYETVTWQQVNDFVVPPEAGYTEMEYIEGQPLVATRLFKPKYNATADKTNYTVVSSEELQRLAVVDPVVGGRLTGKVHYTVFRPFNPKNGTIFPYSYVFSYMLFYPWNGCSNQLLATQVDGKRQGIEYYMCADGAHEGDLEHIKVWVCEDDMLGEDPSVAISRAQYSQHGWLPDFDCKAGECNWEYDEHGVKRLVSYAGLFSHSNYNNASNLYVYEKIKWTSLMNMDGLYIGDRYAKGPVFYPNETNTQWLPYMSEMQPGQLKREFEWAAFPGTWGGTLYSTNGRTVTCLFNNLTAEAPCNATNPAYYILGLVLRPVGANMSHITWGNMDSGNTVSGPLWRRRFAFNWEMERAAPLYSESVMGGFLDQYDGLCPFEANITTPDEGAGVFPHSNLRQFLGAVVGLVLASSVVTFAMVLPMLLVRGEDQLLLQLRREVELIREQAEQAHKQTPPAPGTPPPEPQHIQMQQLPAPPPAPMPPPPAPAPPFAVEAVAAAGGGAAASAAAPADFAAASAASAAAAAAAAAVPIAEAQLMPPQPQQQSMQRHNDNDNDDIDNGQLSGSSSAESISAGAATAAGAGAAGAAAGAAAPAKGGSSPGGKGPAAAAAAPPLAQPHQQPHPAGQQQSIQMSYVDLSHDFISRAFHASVMHRYMLAAWLFVGVSCFICAVVLGVIGLADVATALDRLVPLPLWKVLSQAISVVFGIFGVVNLAIIITSIWIRPRVTMACYGWCYSDKCSSAPGCAGCGCCCCRKMGRMEAARRSWTAHAVLAGLVGIELNVTMLIFALGLMIWVARLGIEESCYFILTGLFTAAYFLNDVCLDLSVIGVDTPVCGADLSALCGVWSDLNVDYLVYGCLLFVIAESMFLVLATTNYVGMRTGAAITSAMDIASRATREAEAAEARRQRRAQQQQARQQAVASGWSGFFKGRRSPPAAARVAAAVAAAPQQSPEGRGGEGGGGGAAPAADSRQVQSSPALALAPGAGSGTGSGVSSAAGGLYVEGPAAAAGAEGAVAALAPLAGQAASRE